MANTKKYWKGLEQYNNDKEFVASNQNEFAEYLPVDEFIGDEKNLDNGSTSRRDFLKYLGFGVAAASLAACETPVTKAIPYLNKPEEIIPGKANYYASSYFDGSDFASILVKTREGRPIFISGNSSSPLTQGAVSPIVNSSVLSLYDNNRLKNPLIDGKEVSWEDIDKNIKKIISDSSNIKVLTSSVISPSTSKLINELLSNNSPETTSEDTEKEVVEATTNNAGWVQYDAVSYSGTLEANKVSFGKAVLPTYNFEKAKAIVSVGADFLSTYGDSLFNVKGYAETRKPEKGWMSKHYQFESNMSLTGSNADVRIPVKPSEYGLILKALYAKLGGDVSATKTSCDAYIAQAAKDLKANKGQSIVVCNSNNKNIQILVNAINNLLANYGKTIDMVNHSNTKKGIDTDVFSLIEEMKSGSVDTLLVYGVDPVFSLGDEFASAMKKVKNTISFSTKLDDTAKATKYVCPDNHALESWNDVNPVVGYYAVAQPTISPLFNTRQFQDSLLKWIGKDTDYLSYIKENFEQNIFTKQTTSLIFNDFWNSVVHDGYVTVNETSEEELLFSANVADAASAIKQVKGKGDFEIELYTKSGIGNGVGADNPWLQEFPDPVSKISWDNYITMSASDMEERGLNMKQGQEEMADVVTITVNNKSVDLPVLMQPGQAKGTIGVALGYGKVVGNMSEPTGKNTYPLVSKIDNKLSYTGFASISEKNGASYLATTQIHHTIMGRESIINETILSTYKKGNKEEFNPDKTLAVHENGENIRKSVNEIDLWTPHPVENIGHRWGMAIDLNTCIGCGSCVTACHAENNVPVVGKDEVRRGRDMHWLRIDRYYSSEYQPTGNVSGTLESTKDATGKGTIAAYREMENPAVNPSVVFQPMMCQHCNHAGCETVCPVAATTHSNEGLNMMAYNRCIGTRYCANNCAYKVRRFNWFNYIAYNKFSEFNPAQDDLGRMVLNPDVVVRSRGVMEKCSMCVQRIQAGKLDAKKAGTKVKDGSIQTACSEACSVNAITFGDLNDNESKVAEGKNSDRSYRVIEEVGQQPNIYYLTKVRNIEEAEA